jgi:DNA-binding response OmpR family regulator
MTDILLVADSSWVVNDVRAALSDGRSSIDVVADPRQVAAAVATRQPDLLLVDLQVGSMGGMAVTRAVRDAAATNSGVRPPIVLMLDRDADAFLAGRSGADAWVRKPFSAEDLRTAVDGVLARS